MDQFTPPSPPRGQLRSSKCSRPSKRKKSTKPSISDASPRFRCSYSGCTSSFRRSSDQARHEKSIHGPKQQCSYQGCSYWTGRPDKLNEHTRKIHKTAGKSIVPFARSSTDHCSAAPNQSPYISQLESNTPYQPATISVPLDLMKFDTPNSATPPSSSSPASYKATNSTSNSASIDWSLNNGVFEEDRFMDCPIYSDFGIPVYADMWSLAPGQTCVAPFWDISFEWFG